MNILIIYYSGTNNTKYLVDKQKVILEMQNHSVYTYDIIRNKCILDKDDFDLIILNYPIYAFNPPKLFLKGLKALELKNKKVIIIKNSGEPLSLNDASSLSIKHILKRTNSQIISEYHLLMPYYIMFRHQDNMVKQMLIYNDRYLHFILNDLFQVKRIRYHILARICSIMGLFERIGANINSSFISVDMNKCIICKKCENACQFNNIQVNDKKIVFSNHCQLCMNCCKECPTNAIKMGMFNHWKVNGKYDFDSILLNPNLDGDYVSKSSKRFQKVYKKYFYQIDELLKNKP